MDSLDPKLFQEYIQQAFGILERKEKAFLEASESDSPRAIGEVRRLVFLLQKLARAVRRPNLYEFLEGVTAHLEYCEDNWSYLGPRDKEGLLDLYDCLVATFRELSADENKNSFSSAANELFMSTKASVAARKNSLNFNLGAKKRPQELSEFEEIQKLSKDLVVFERGVAPHQMQEESRRHLKAIALRLSTLADKINLKPLSSLFGGLQSKFGPKGFHFGFYGEHRSADRRVVNALEKAFEEALNSAFFSTEDENPEALFKASEESGCLRIEAQLNRVKLSKEVIKKFEEKLESMGFETSFTVDPHSGTCIEALAPKTLNSIEGQVIESWGSLFALDMRFVKECVQAKKEAFFRRRDGRLFMNSEFGQLPVLDLGLKDDDFDETLLDVVILERQDFKVAVPAQKIHRRQSLSLRGLMQDLPDHKYYKAVCLLENSMPGLLLNAKAILNDFKSSELKYSKYISIKTPQAGLLIRAEELLEIAPYEKISRLPSENSELYGMINYDGEPILVRSLEERLGMSKIGDHRHILICKDQQGVFGLAVGSEISVVRKLKEEAYSEPAFSVAITRSLIKEVYYEDGQEFLTLKVDALRENSEGDRGAVKKVA